MANDAVVGDALRSTRVRQASGKPPRPAREHLRHTEGAPTSEGPTGEACGPPAPAPSTQSPPTAELEHTLAAFLTAEVEALADIDPALDAFGRIARDCVLAGGKRLRPAFAYWGWRGVIGGQSPVAAILPALAALELLHTFALVHDDVMDSSAARRGRPTAHRVLATRHASAGQTGDAERFGAAGAVLIGDLCLVWADGLMSRAALSPGTLLAARSRYDRMRVETVAGQYLDVLSETDARRWSVGRALRVARYKTASYTVRGPLLFGAALAGLGPEDPPTDAYGRYGRAIGEAFQLRDDLLGVYGDPRTTGKPAGDDLRTGKPTVLLMIARQLADPGQRAELERGLATVACHAAVHPDADPTVTELADQAVAQLGDLVAATGASRRVEAMISDRVAAALEALDSSQIDPTARAALADLAVTATDRWT